jgi:NADPH:quinone reductase-like Zn-dependent oxidoreductase
MRAIVYHEYSPRHVPQLADSPEPTIGDDDLLIGPRATAVDHLEWH